MANIKQAFEYAAQNPDSEFATNLKQLAASGSLNQEAQKYGIDLSAFQPKPEETPSSNLMDKLSQRKQNIDNIILSDVNPVRGNLRAFGQLAGGVGDVFGAGIGAAASGINQLTGGTAGQSLQSGVQTILDTDIGKQGLELAKQGMEAYSAWKQANPGVAADLEAVVNIGSLIPIGKGGQLIGETAVGGTLAGAVEGYKYLKTTDPVAYARILKQDIQAKIGRQTVEPTFESSAKRLTGATNRMESPVISYDKYISQAKSAMADTKVDAPISDVGSKIGDAFKQVVKDRKAIGKIMGDELKTVGNLKVDISPAVKNFGDLLDEAGIVFDKDVGKLVTSDLTKVAPQDVEIMNILVDELNRVGNNPSVGQLDALISRVSANVKYAQTAKGITSVTNGERIIKNALANLRNVFDDVPGLEKYNSAKVTYGELSNFIDDGSGYLGKITQTGDFAKDASIAKSSVQSILNNGKKDWLLKLEELTGYRALDESTLALQAMKDAGDFRGLSLLETMSEGKIPTSKTGATQQIMDYVLNKGIKITTGTPEERTRAFLQSLEGNVLKNPAPTNIKINTAMPASGVKTIPTTNTIKKSDAVISKRVPQSTKKASGKLISEEARKYKSAEEFVKAQNNFFHGTAKGNKFEVFDMSKGNTGAGGNPFYQGDQIYLTNNKAAAEWFAEGATEKSLLKSGKLDYSKPTPAGEVLEFTLPKTAKIKYVENMPATAEKAKIVLDKAKADGYDAISFEDWGIKNIEGDPRSLNMFKNGKAADTTIVLNPDKLKTKQQLTDLWNKANGKN